MNHNHSEVTPKEIGQAVAAIITFLLESVKAPKKESFEECLAKIRALPEAEAR